MKKLLVILALCLSSLASWAQQYDFSAEAPTGQTLYYKITTGYTVAVVCPGETWSGFTKPTGSLTIPDHVTNGETTYSVTAIGEGAFFNCTDLTSVSIPDLVTVIGDFAFHNCTGLTGVTIHNRVYGIGSQVFSGCSGLATLVVDGYNPVYDSRNNCNAIIETATNTLLFGTKNTVIPSTVTTIGEYAFRGHKGLTGLTIPNSVTTIERNAFYECSGLASVTIPNSVTALGKETFANCSGLTSVTIGNGMTTISESAFAGCGLTSVTIPNSVGSIGAYAFEACIGLTSVTIPNSVYAIAGGAFYNCIGLSHIGVPNSVTTIGEDAFVGIDTVYYYQGSATGSPWGADVVITTGGYTEAGDPLVYESPYKTMVFGCNTAATSVTIPNTVISICEGAFGGHENLCDLLI